MTGGQLIALGAYMRGSGCPWMTGGQLTVYGAHMRFCWDHECGNSYCYHFGTTVARTLEGLCSVGLAICPFFRSAEDEWALIFLRASPVPPRRLTLLANAFAAVPLGIGWPPIRYSIQGV